MPKSFHFDIEFKYPIDDVHRTLTDPNYWKGRLGDLYATSDIEVRDGSIEVSVSEEIDSASLPSLVAKVAPSRLGLKRVDRWGGPLSDGRAAGSVTGIARGTADPNRDDARSHRRRVLHAVGRRRNG